MPSITLYGAAKEVTGSCYLVETGESRFLVDCGLFQGPPRLEKLNNIPSGLQAKRIDAVFLTHGHLDHCGRLPLLWKAGFRGPVYATAGSIDIAKLILRDAAKIQADDARRESAKRARYGEPPVEPLFTIAEVDKLSALFRCVEYDTPVDVFNGVSVNFVDAGHILGSSSLIFKFSLPDELEKTIVFSGDLGQWNVPLLRDPSVIESADVVVMEATYGDRDHRSHSDTLAEFEELIKSAIAHKGKILIPTFAVGRAQQVLYYLSKMFRDAVIPHFPIFLDSPMAIAASEVYLSHVEVMDEEAQALNRSGELRKCLKGVHACVSPEESTALNSVEGPCLILAGAGMCNAGRILHHLRHGLSNPNTVVLIVGFQPSSSLGRRLLEGAEEVKIHGKTIAVRATVKGLGGLSAHAGQSDLVRWLTPMVHSGSPRVILTHGESNQIKTLARRLAADFGITAEIPMLGEKIEF